MAGAVRAAGGFVDAVILALKTALLYLEPRLTFYPVREYFDTPAAAGLPFEDVHLDTEDGVRIHGWFVPAGERARGDRSSAAGRAAVGSSSQRRPITLLFFHGNAENIGGGLGLAAPPPAAGGNLLLLLSRRAPLDRRR